MGQRTSHIVGGSSPRASGSALRSKSRAKRVFSTWVSVGLLLSICRTFTPFGTPPTPSAPSPRARPTNSRQYGKVPSGIGSMTWAKPAPSVPPKALLFPFSKGPQKKSQAPPDPFFFSIRNTRSCPHTPPSSFAHSHSFSSDASPPPPAGYRVTSAGPLAGWRAARLDYYSLAELSLSWWCVWEGGEEGRGSLRFQFRRRRVSRLSAWRLLR